MKLTFMGATSTVTGSKYLLEQGAHKVLVDCGLFQGIKELRLRNWSHFPMAPGKIDAVVLTHAHIDHSGYLPLLALQGFKGPIYATKATIDLCSILLPDSGHLQEEDAKLANKYHYSKHEPALPLYTEEDALEVLKQFKEVEFDTSYPLFEGMEFSWHGAGHILGSAFIKVKTGQRELLFSGDIGRLHDPIMKPPTIMTSTDYLVMESTYGDRLHEKTEPLEHIAQIINKTYARGGTVVIPAFAVGRAQSMLYYLYHLKQRQLIPDIPIYLDSPMAINATEILLNSCNEHRLKEEECEAICHVAQYTQTPDQSRAIDRDTGPKIIISASGMMTGGRILHHLKVFLPNPSSTILITGYQALGTRGDRMLRGEPTVKIHGENIEVKAEIEQLSSTSAHADYEEILVWLSHFKQKPRKVFITHGDPNASIALKQHIETRLGWVCVIPKYLEQFELD